MRDEPPGLALDEDGHVTGAGAVCVVDEALGRVEVGELVPGIDAGGVPPAVRPPVDLDVARYGLRRRAHPRRGGRVGPDGSSIRLEESVEPRDPSDHDGGAYDPADHHVPHLSPMRLPGQTTSVGDLEQWGVALMAQERFVDHSLEVVHRASFPIRLRRFAIALTTSWFSAPTEQRRTSADCHSLRSS